MSEAPAPLPSRTPASPKIGRRASDLLALALVAVSVGVVSASAAPSVARELGLTSASLSRRDVGPHPALGVPGASPHAPARRGGAGLPDLVAPPGDDEPGEDPGDARLAIAVRDVVVRDRADERGATLGKVPRGELLIVIREAGAWAMVAHLGGEGSTTGWVRRGDLAIR